MKSKTADALGWLLGGAIIVAIFGLAIWWQVYKFGDCRHVGHARLYCIMSIGR